MGTFILLEIVTLGLSIIIEFKGSIDAIISLAEDGYIVDKNRYLEKQKSGTFKTKKKWTACILVPSQRPSVPSCMMTRGVMST